MRKLTTLFLFLFSSMACTAALQPDKGVANLVINEFLADPVIGLSGDANGDGTRDTADDEFVEIYNHSDNNQDISGWTLSDNSQVRHTFPSGTVVPGRCSIVVFGGGNPTGVFGFSTVQSASTGSLILNNGGDTITLKSGNSTIATHTYGSEASVDQSLTRDPVGSGVFIEHDSATGANGALFSPGTNPDGSFFSGCPTGDLAPTVSSTTPATNAGGVATNATITINFSEGVDIAANAFTLNCGAANLSYSTAPATPLTNQSSITLTPDAALPDGSFCSVTAIASLITDTDEGLLQLDGNKDTTAGDNYSWTFVTGTPNFEIWEIQGNGTETAYQGFTIGTNDNIITALDTNGFYIQTPDARSDNDPNTSDGLFVYTGQNPQGTYAVGDQVDVSGPIIEFYGTTEFTTPVVINVDSSGNTLPTPITLDDNFPPNDPSVAVCSTDQTTHKWECLEGMPFNMPQGFVSAGFAGNPVFPGREGEDILVRAGSSRAFREEGIDYPGNTNVSPLIYDGNPEILQIDLDGLGFYTLRDGSNNLIFDYTQLAGGTEISAKGVFVYDFNVYKITPSELTVTNANTLPDTVRNATNTEVTIGSANLFRLFDDVDNSTPGYDDTVSTTENYNRKLAKLSLYIRNSLKAPMILAVQEAEKIEVLNALAAKILADSNNTINYTAHLIEGNDPGGIDIGFLVLDNVTVADGFPKQLGVGETFLNPNGNFQSTLHDRPPLHLQADIALGAGTISMQVIAVHNRSRGKIEDNNALEAARVRTKRFEQANSIAAMINTIQTNNPNAPIITLGDFNAFQFSDGYADVIGQITGTAVEADNEYWAEPLFKNSPLTQAMQTLPATEQYSYVFGGSAQLLDNAILNDVALTMMNEVEFARGQADANINYADNASNSLRVSDHDGFVLFLTKDFDTIFKNGFEAPSP